MLTFKNINILFVSVLLLLIAGDILYDLPLIIFPILLVLYSLILFYGCYYIGSNFFMKVFCSAKTERKEIAISFDDGPAENFTPLILKTLKEHNVKAGFFCIGNRIAGNENIFKQLKEEDHIIGNHSYTHDFFFDLFSSKRMLHELKMMDGDTVKITGLKPKLFRPPYGVMNPNLRKAIIEGGYIPVGWNVRSMDTVIKDKKKLLNKILKALKPGAVYLFHDTSASTVEILPAFIRQVKELGYEIVRLDKMMNLAAYA
ncbi:MAG: polysaccharide deacetylase family protein [Ferruginibacter sp.]|nr:polysaccharide deacetylase family protein [Ferruginibacter sp.]